MNLISSKIRIIYILAFTLAFLLGIFALRWQVVDAARLTSEIEQRKRSYLIPSVRGPIMARDGSTLAYSEPRFDLFVYTREMQYAEVNKLQTRDEFIQKVLPFTGGTKEELEELFQEKTKQGISWFKIAKGITLDQKLQVEKLTCDKDKGLLEGITPIYSQQRFYPEGQLAAHVIGLADTNEDGTMIGRSGIEGDRNGELEPQKGYVTYDIDAAGNPVTGTTDVTVQAKRGSTIVTTIDKFLQQKLEEGIKSGLERFQAKSASGIIMDPKTGEIWALANYPTYDPNNRKADDPAVFGNANLSQPYEIGSVGKAFTLAAAIDNKTYKPDDTVIDGHNGCELLIEGFKVCNLFNRKSGPLSLTKATVNSDNVAYYHISKTLTPPVLYKYLDKFGVGHASGIDRSESHGGALKSPERWNENDISAYSYGTSYQLNAVQAISGVSALANYGVRMQPRLVSKIISADGKEIELKPQPVERVISEESSQVVNSVLHQVYQSNLTGWPYSSLKRYPLAMKSGTGLIVRDGVYTSDYNGTYVGYDISTQRKFVMLIRLDSPKIGRVSSENARMVWLDTFMTIKDYLGINQI
jgi:cell division protein FtsI/penicillin-binding protein 2